MGAVDPPAGPVQDGDNVLMLKLMQGRRPGNEIPLEIQRGDETITLRVTLGKRPV